MMHAAHELNGRHLCARNPDDGGADRRFAQVLTTEPLVGSLPVPYLSYIETGHRSLPAIVQCPRQTGCPISRWVAQLIVANPLTPAICRYTHERLLWRNGASWLNGDVGRSPARRSCHEVPRR
jgi:hypothetical protein